jgi:hypothetical protein
MVADYTRSLDQFRLRQTGDVGTEDIVSENGIARSFSVARNSRARTSEAALILPVEDLPLYYCDPWSRGLVFVPLPDTISYVPFETLLARGAKVRRVGRRIEPAGDSTVVELSYDRGPRKNAWTLELSFDPKANHLIRKCVLECSQSADGQKIHREAEVVQFKEAAPAVYFPERVRSSISIDDQVYETGDFQVSDIRVNAPLPQNAFRLRYTPGMFLENRVQGTRYKVDAGGNPISPPEAFPELPLPPTAPDEPGPPSRRETKEEPKDASRWLLPCSLGILAVGGLMGYLRHRRQLAERGDSTHA